MAKHRQAIEQPPVPTLRVSRFDAEKALVEQLKIGEEVRDRVINSIAALEEAKATRSRWKDYVTLMLKRFLTTDEFALEFNYSSRGSYSMSPSPAQRVQYFHDDMQASINKLQSTIDRLALLDEPVVGPVELNATQVDQDSSVFIVHGQDDGARESVARFIGQLGLKPIILHEQPNRGRTIIEKLEGHSSVGFAVVLLTPDDVGGRDKETLRPRARQNVILELGFFCGTLTRARVCALHKGDIELPSDFDGVVYIPFDTEDGWRLRLAREMKEAGLPVDLNKAV